MQFPSLPGPTRRDDRRGPPAVFADPSPEADLRHHRKRHGCLRHRVGSGTGQTVGPILWWEPVTRSHRSCCRCGLTRTEDARRVRTAPPQACSRCSAWRRAELHPHRPAEVVEHTQGRPMPGRRTASSTPMVSQWGPGKRRNSWCAGPTLNGYFAAERDNRRRRSDGFYRNGDLVTAATTAIWWSPGASGCRREKPSPPATSKKRC